MPQDKDTTALIFGNNPDLEKILKDFFLTKEIKVADLKQTTHSGPAHYNLFVFNPSLPLKNQLGQMIDLLDQSDDSGQKYALIIQQSSLNKNSPDKAHINVFQQLTQERNLNSRLVYVWDLINSDPKIHLSSLDQHLKQAIKTAQVSLSQDGNQTLFPLDTKDFLAGLAHSLFTQSSSGQSYVFAGQEIADLELFLLLKQLMLKQNQKLDIIQELKAQDVNPNLQDQVDATSVRLDWVPQVDIQETLNFLVKSVDQTKVFLDDQPSFSPSSPSPFFSPRSVSTPYPSEPVYSSSPSTSISPPVKIRPKLRQIKIQSQLVDGSLKSVEIHWLLKALSGFSLFIFSLLAVIFISFVFFFKTSIGQLKLAQDSLVSPKKQSIPTLISSSQRRLDLSQQIYSLLRPSLNLIDPQLSQSFDAATTVLEYSQQIVGKLHNLNLLTQSFYLDSLNKQTVNVRDVSASLLGNLESLQSQLNQLSLLDRKDLSQSRFLQVTQSSIPYLTDDSLLSLQSQISPALSFAKILPFALPADNLNQFLIVIQDNNEYRASGGFLNSYIYLSLKGNQLLDIQADSFLKLSGQLEGIVTPPSQLTSLTGENNWPVHQANYFPNFPDTANQLSWFWEKINQVSLDGVIAINLDTIEDILQITGPLSLSDGRQISADNLRLNLVSPTQQDADDPLTQITKQLVQKIQSQQISPTSLITSFLKAAVKGDLYFWIKDNAAQSLAADNNFSGLISPASCPLQFATSDCLAETIHFNEANYSVNKSNFYQHRHFNYLISINQVGSINHQLIVDYSYPDPVPRLANSVYQALINLYLPASHRLESISLDEKPVPLEQINTVHKANIIQISFPLSYTLNQNHRLIINSQSGRSLNLSGSQTSYSLHLIKQSGSQNTTQTVTVSYPKNLLPQVISLPADYTADSISFQTLPATSTSYAISFAVR